MIFLDSDDKILPGSINYLYKIWNLKTNIQKNEIAGFLAHSVNKKKKNYRKKMATLFKQRLLT